MIKYALALAALTKYRQVQKITQNEGKQWRAVELSTVDHHHHHWSQSGFEPRRHNNGSRPSGQNTFRRWYHLNCQNCHRWYLYCHNQNHVNQGIVQNVNNSHCQILCIALIMSVIRVNLFRVLSKDLSWICMSHVKNVFLILFQSDFFFLTQQSNK